MSSRSQKWLFVPALLLLAIAGLEASIPERYQSIIDRNAFGLNPPPVQTVETNAAPPPANVKLTGFATINGVKRAFFVITPKDPKDPAQYVNLPEGQREGILEVLRISEGEGEVKIKNSGTDSVLSLEKNGFKPATLAPGVSAAPTNPSGGMPGPGGAAPSPVYNPTAPSSVVATYNTKVVAGAPPVANPPVPPLPGEAPQPGQPSQGNVQPNTGAPPAPPAPPGGMRTIPTRTLRLPNNPQQ